jgi:DNA-binding MurR/RpiR family transcriptional regulator
VDSPYGMDLTSAASFLRFVKHLGAKTVAAYREEIVFWVGAERAAFMARPQFSGHTAMMNKVINVGIHNLPGCRNGIG